MPYWADASYVIGLSDPKDRWHRAACAIHAKLGGKARLRTHALAVAEVVTRLTRTVGVEKAQAAYFATKDDMEVHVPLAQDLDDAMDLAVDFDGELSLSDSLFVQFMAKCDVIVSFDGGFGGKVKRLPATP